MFPTTRLWGINEIIENGRDPKKELDIDTAPIVIHNKYAMSSYARSLPDSTTEILNQIRELYTSFFDQNWLSLFLNDLPMTRGQFHDIRSTLTIGEPQSTDIQTLHYGISAFETFIQLLKEIVMPKISDIRVTHYGSRRFDAMSLESRTKMKLIIHLLPRNIAQLDSLVNNLKEALPPVPPSIQKTT